MFNEKEYQKEYRRKNKDSINLGKRIWRRNNHTYRVSEHRRRVARVRAFLAEYKVEKGCIDCGYNKHFAALEFDHVVGIKKSSVASLVSWRAIMEEISKCVVRCANCHAIRHNEERGASDTGRLKGRK